MLNNINIIGTAFYPKYEDSAILYLRKNVNIVIDLLINDFLPIIVKQSYSMNYHIRVGNILM